MKHIIIFLTLLLLVTPAWSGTLVDTFDDGNMDEWSEIGRGTWHIDNGEVVINSQEQLLFTIGEITWKDYTVSIKMKIPKNQFRPAWFGGIGLRYTPPWNLYGFCLIMRAGNQKNFLMYRQQGWLIAWDVVFTPFQWKPDTWHDLRTTVEGGNFKFYIDDELVSEYKNKVYPTGQVSFGGGHFTITHYDDFVVTGDDVPNTNFSVSAKSKLADIWGNIKYNQQFIRAREKTNEI